jgi:hypothetical protein
MAGRTQAVLYSEIAMALSWSEEELPQVERTKHVHSLHPYLGKYIPQLVKAFLDRYFVPGQTVYDPFVGSGTTLVEANVFGADGIGCDISGFNCLLSRVKSSRYGLAELELALRGALEQTRRTTSTPTRSASPWLRTWFAERTLAELLSYRTAIERLEPQHADVARVVLSRAARSARLTTHFDLDFPRTPTTEPYYCHKHKRVCRPVDEAQKFLVRYTNDTIRRLREFAEIRTTRSVRVLHADAREVGIGTTADGVITSPPYPGLIDYHEQHRYAYELLGLADRRVEEIGAAAGGRSQRSLRGYVEAMSSVLANTRLQLARGAWVLIVVNDSQNLYPEILDKAGLVLVERTTRHVNRRTGRRAGEFFEDVLVCRTP